MNIPTANTVEIIVNPGFIITDNSINLMYTNIEAKQLINQAAINEQDYIISLEHPSRIESSFSITIPNSTTRIQSHSTPFTRQYNRKLKIMYMLIFLTYMCILFFTVIFISHHGKWIYD